MAEQPQATGLPDGALSEWKPSKATWRIWTILSIPIWLLGLDIYMVAAFGGSASGTVGFGQLMLWLVLTTGLTLVIMCVHEGVHGVAMLRFGAKPQFGILKIEGIVAGMYATAPGHRFSRNQYLAICLAPLAILAPLGIPACMLPFGGYLVMPLAMHLAGCIGDVTIAWHVLRGPSEVVCEDLRDGLRLWKAEA